MLFHIFLAFIVDNIISEEKRKEILNVNSSVMVIKDRFSELGLVSQNFVSWIYVVFRLLSALMLSQDVNKVISTLGNVGRICGSTNNTYIKEGNDNLHF